MAVISRINALIRLLQSEGITYDGIVFYCDIVTKENASRMNQVAILETRIKLKKKIIITHHESITSFSKN